MNHVHLLADLDLDLDCIGAKGAKGGTGRTDTDTDKAVGIGAGRIGGSGEILAAAEKARLEEHLAGCADCRRERESLQMLHASLAASVIAPREGFTGEVMRALVPAPWEARALVVWRWPFAMLLALGGLAAVLLGGAAAELEPGAGSFDTFIALARLLESAALAGAGLLGASWQGLGSGLGEWLGASKTNLGLAGGLLLGLNLLFLRLLRPSSRKAKSR